MISFGPTGPFRSRAAVDGLVKCHTKEGGLIRELSSNSKAQDILSPDCRRQKTEHAMNTERI